jgi:hypothetical protein
MYRFKGDGEYFEDHGLLISHIFMPAIFLELSMSCCICHNGWQVMDGVFENTVNLVIAVAFKGTRRDHDIVLLRLGQNLLYEI